MFIPDTKLFVLKNQILRIAGAQIGQNVRICSSAKILGNGKLIIGSNTWIGHECLIICSSNVMIGSDVDIAPRVYIGTGTHIIDIKSNNVAGQGISKDVKINNGCWIGVNSTILPGVELGEKSIIAAGAVVNRDTVAFTISGGVPARLIRNIINL